MSSSKEEFVVEVRFDIEKDSKGYPKSRHAEALLCKPLDPECLQCVVSSIPFYVRSVAYGDTISTEDHPSGYLQFKDVVKRGGYSVYRILLRGATQKDQLISNLLNFGVLIEQEGNLISIAVPRTVESDSIVDFILEGKSKGFWGAQDGYVFEES